MTQNDYSNQVRDLIVHSQGGDIPGWMKPLSAALGQVEIRSAESRLLSWMKAMSVSGRFRELTLNEDPWSHVLRKLVVLSGYLTLVENGKRLALSDTLTDESKMQLCRLVVEEHHPRVRK